MGRAICRGPSAQALDVHLDIFDAARSAQPTVTGVDGARILMMRSRCNRPRSRPLRVGAFCADKKLVRYASRHAWRLAAAASLATAAGGRLDRIIRRCSQRRDSATRPCRGSAIALPDGEELITTYLDEG